MHEMSIILSVIDVVTAYAKEEGAKQISQVELEIGDLAGVMIDSLEFCFEAACTGTIAEGSRLNIIRVPGRGKCLDCHRTFKVETFFAICPHCKGYLIDITQGKDLRVKSIEVD